jgi:hypothetical protein
MLTKEKILGEINNNITELKRELKDTTKFKFVPEKVLRLLAAPKHKDPSAKYDSNMSTLNKLDIEYKLEIYNQLKQYIGTLKGDDIAGQLPRIYDQTLSAFRAETAAWSKALKEQFANEVYILHLKEDAEPEQNNLKEMKIPVQKLVKIALYKTLLKETLGKKDLLKLFPDLATGFDPVKCCERFKELELDEFTNDFADRLRTLNPLGFSSVAHFIDPETSIIFKALDQDDRESRELDIRMAFESDNPNGQELNVNIAGDADSSYEN